MVWFMYIWVEVLYFLVVYDVIEQFVYCVYVLDKVELVSWVLQVCDCGVMMIFICIKWIVQKVVDELIECGFVVGVVYGDFGQLVCEKVFKVFCIGGIDVLVVIDVVVCGIDIDDVIYVINYQCFEDEKMYVYCIGCIGCVG